eukprot:TRINITY_DN2978_c0_g1_i14.p1 TRINITY_DN2978_c0_g1~~TRINITY_DN2978_c0_g1_i14.p1  ORF type:complete len:115 (+),score=48.35 TRINITY_DN2978_c0_g1_i14:46-345(+)
MLRSLVGSEMCIRDRIYTVHVWMSVSGADTCDGTIGQTTFACKFAKFLSVMKYDGHNYDCLLYTSDAADEEDSVDLGGRRILKKKKNRVVGVARELNRK